MTPTVFDGTLKDLMKHARSRVNRASRLIASSDDPDVIDREMRLIRPFWEFLHARKTFNQTAFWKRFQSSLGAPQTTLLYRKNDLAWLPEREPLCDALATQRDQSLRMIRLLRGVDLIVSNFIRLIARMRFSVGIDSSDRFILKTQETGSPAYTLQLRRLERETPDGKSYLVTTCQLIQPDGEAIKIERDSSESVLNPFVSITLHNASIAGERRILWDGVNDDLKQGKKGRLQVRT